MKMFVVSILTLLLAAMMALPACEGTTRLNSDGTTDGDSDGDTDGDTDSVCDEQNFVIEDIFVVGIVSLA